MRNVLLGVVGFVTVAALTGCSSSASAPTAGSDGSEDGKNPIIPPAQQAGQGEQASSTEAYAPGPFGINIKSIIANYQFVGFPNEQADHASTGLHLIQLADFYNPTGTGTFPAGSPYGDGTPKPKALLIDVASVWCGPCNDEAKTTLPGKYTEYKPRGGEFLLQLADGPKVGTAAVPKNLYNWTESYKVAFPSTIDPSYKIGALFVDDAFPTNIIIDTKTMEIVDVFAGDTNPSGGAEPLAFWKKYESLLNPAP